MRNWPIDQFSVSGFLFPVFYFSCFVFFVSFVVKP